MSEEQENSAATDIESSNSSIDLPSDNQPDNENDMIRKN